MLLFAYEYQDEYYRMPDKLAKQRDIDIGKMAYCKDYFYNLIF